MTQGVSDEVYSVEWAIVCFASSVKASRVDAFAVSGVRFDLSYLRLAGGTMLFMRR